MLTIKEIEEKEKVEIAVREAVINFQDTTGLIITDIDIDYAEVSSMGKKNREFLVSDVKVRVELP
ncbi:MAG: hypothetical protein ACTSQY_10855 [Candidatus Odinarchaeia archaeon]